MLIDTTSLYRLKDTVKANTDFLIEIENMRMKLLRDKWEITFS